jgi:Fic family protein
MPPPHWDGESPTLRQNLERVLRRIGVEAAARAPLKLATIQSWHREMMADLHMEGLPPNAAGGFRGEAGLNYDVHVGGLSGVSVSQVTAALAEFEVKLVARVAKLDAAIAAGALPTDQQIEDILETCGWAHAEWVRIHPFCNGNGRTARLLTNAIAQRYRLPVFVRLRPRPEGNDYAAAGAAAMRGDWAPTVSVLRRYLNKKIGRP